MLVNPEYSSPFAPHSFPSLARGECNVIRRFRAGEWDIVFEKMPQCTGEDFTYIHFALLAYLDGELYCEVAIESLDLRSLSSSLGESLRELQNEYGVRGYVTKPRLVIYGDERREELEEVTSPLKEELVLPYMMDFLLDSLDCTAEPETVG